MSLVVSIYTGNIFTDVKLLATFQVLATRMKKTLSVVTSSLTPIFPQIQWIEQSVFDRLSTHHLITEYPIFTNLTLSRDKDFSTFLNQYLSQEIVCVTCTVDFETVCHLELCQHITVYEEKLQESLRGLHPHPTLSLPSSSMLVFVSEEESSYFRKLIQSLLIQRITPILPHSFISKSFVDEFQSFLPLLLPSPEKIFLYHPTKYVITNSIQMDHNFRYVMDMFGWSPFVVDETSTSFTNQVNLYDFMISYPMPSNQSMKVIGVPSAKRTFLLADRISPFLRFAFQNVIYKFKGWVEHFIVCPTDQVYEFVTKQLGYVSQAIRKRMKPSPTDYVYTDEIFVCEVDENEVVTEKKIQDMDVEELRRNIEQYQVIPYVGKMLQQTSFLFDPYLFSKAYQLSSGDILRKYSMNQGLLCDHSQVIDLFPHASVYQGNDTIYINKDMNDESSVSVSLNTFVNESFLTLTYESLIQEVYVHLPEQQQELPSYTETIHFLFLDLSASTLENPSYTFPSSAPFTVIVSEQDVFETIMTLPEKYIFIKVNAVGAKEWLWMLVADNYLCRNSIGGKYYVINDNRISEYDTSSYFTSLADLICFMNNNLQVGGCTCHGNLHKQDSNGIDFLHDLNPKHNQYYFMLRNVGIYRVCALRKIIEKCHNTLMVSIRNGFLHDQEENSPYQSIKRILGYSLYSGNQYILEISPYQKKRKCIIFACYIRSKLYYDLLLYTLQLFCKLREVDIYLIYSSNHTNMVLPSYEWLKTIRVPNEGYDIKKYIFGLDRVKGKYDTYVLTNDSIVFLRNPSFLFTLLDHVHHDFISLTDSNDRKYHYQSFFLAINNSVCDELLSMFKYLLQRGGTMTKEEAITKFEVGMSHQMTNSRDTLCLYKFGFFHREKDYQLKNSTAIDQIRRYYNETMIPFMKLRFAFDNRRIDADEIRLVSVREQVKKILLSCNNRYLYEILLKHTGSTL